MKISKLLLVLIAISLLLTACGGDDPASSNDPDPPELPSFQNVEADVSYFEQSPSKSANDNYNNAKGYALSLASISAYSNVYAGLFNTASNQEADYNNGQWTWEYNNSVEGQSATIQLVGQEVDDTMNWAMFISYDDGEGNSVQDYKIVEGQIATDGTSGSWTFNDLDAESNTEFPVLETTWERSSETNVVINMDFYDESQGQMHNYRYTREGSVYDMTFTGSSQSNNIYVHWETDVGTGYYQIGDDQSERLCWDDSLADVSCSSVGY